MPIPVSNIQMSLREILECVIHRLELSEIAIQDPPPWSVGVSSCQLIKHGGFNCVVLTIIVKI